MYRELEKLFVVPFVTLSLLMIGCGKHLEEKQKEAHELDTQLESLLVLREYAEGITIVRKAIVLNNELQQDSTVAEKYLTLGIIQRKLGQYDSAVVTFKLVVERGHNIGNKVIERKAKIALADLLSAMHSYSDAATLALEAAVISKFSADWQRQYDALTIAAPAYQRMAQYESALKTIDEMTRLDNDKLDNRYYFSILEQRWNAYIGSHQLDNSYTLFQLWKQQSLLRRDTLSIVRAYVHLGQLQESLRQLDSAFYSYTQAQEYLKIHPDTSFQQKIFTLIGDLAYQKKDFRTAMKYYTSALELVRHSQNVPFEQALLLRIIACGLFAKNDIKRQEIGVLQQRCLAIYDTCEQIGFRACNIFTSILLGRLAEQQNEMTSAFKFYEQALQYYEENTSHPFAFEALSSIPVFPESENFDYYEALIQLHCSLDHSESAFTTTERRNLYDIVQYFSQMDIHPSDRTLSQKITEVQWRRNSKSLLEQDILKVFAEQPLNVELLHSLQQLYPKRKAELSEAEDDLNSKFANYSRLLQLEPITTEQIQTSLADGSALIEYATTTGTSCIIVIKRDTIFMKHISEKLPTILSMVKEYCSLISDARMNGNDARFNLSFALSRMEKLSKTLYTLLLQPLQQELKDVQKLYIVTPKEFGFLPIHTLSAEGNVKENGGALSLHINVSYLPSAGSLLFQPIPQQELNYIAGMGHPGTTKWDVEYEIKDIRAFYDSVKTLFDSSATLERLRQMQYNVLHIAAEFTDDLSLPGNSAMILSDGKTPFGLRKIQIGELVSIPTAQTIVISNLSPIAGSLFRYTPLLLLANGTRNVIATMWPGERKAKKYFGEVFYTNLVEGKSASEAYRLAIVALASDAEFSQLYRWGLYYQFGK